MNIKAILFVLVFFTVNSLKAQLSVNTTPGNCYDGTITVTGTLGGCTAGDSNGVETMVVSLISPSPIIRPEQNSQTFSNLIPGTYYVFCECSDGDTATLITVVGGSYTLISYTQAVEGYTCSGVPNTVRVSNVTGGNISISGQYQAQILPPSVYNNPLDPLNDVFVPVTLSGGSFTLQTPSPYTGEFRIRVKDDCNGIIANQIIVPVSGTSNCAYFWYNALQHQYVGTQCLPSTRMDFCGDPHSAQYNGFTLQFYDGLDWTTPFTSYTLGVGTNLPNGHGNTAPIILPSSMKISFRLYGPCGNIISQNAIDYSGYSSPYMNAVTGDAGNVTCSTPTTPNGRRIRTWGSFGGSSPAFHPFSNIEFRIFDKNGVLLEQYVNGSNYGINGAWMSIDTIWSGIYADGIYVNDQTVNYPIIMEFKDACGIVYRDTVNDMETPDSNLVYDHSEYVNYCFTSMNTTTANIYFGGYVSGFYYSDVATIKIISLSDPTGFTARIYHKDSFEYYLRFESMMNSENKFITLNNIPNGTYRAVFSSLCMTDSFDFVINNTNMPAYSHTDSAYATCGGSKIISRLQANFSNVLLRVTGPGAYNNDFSITNYLAPLEITNLAAGTYTLVYHRSQPGDYCYIALDSLTIEVPDSGNPKLEGLFFYQCNVGGNPPNVGRLSIQASGVYPLQFLYREKGTSTWLNTGVTSVGLGGFEVTGLPYNKVYEARIIDACGNELQAAFSGNPRAGLRIVRNQAICTGNNVVLRATRLPGATYQWYKNGTAIGTNRSITFTPYTSSDDGIYICVVTVSSTCRIDTIAYNLSSFTCNTTFSVNDINNTWCGVPVDGRVMTNDYDIDGGTQIFRGFFNQASNFTTLLNSGDIVSGYDKNKNFVANAGTISFNNFGNYTFIPSVGFEGTVQVYYHVDDNLNLAIGKPIARDTSSLTINVTCMQVNNSIIANNDYNISWGEIVGNCLLANDYDPENDIINFTSFTYDNDGNPSTPLLNGTIGVPFTVGGRNQDGTYNANAGTVTIGAEGCYEYTPSLGFNGYIEIPYVITDNNTIPAITSAVLHIDVFSSVTTNMPPFAGDDFAVTCQDNSVTGNWLNNDNDPEDSYFIVNHQTNYLMRKSDLSTLPSQGIGSYPTENGGTIAFNRNGTYTYTPAPNFYGNDRFAYSIEDVNVFQGSYQSTLFTDSATIYFLVRQKVTIGDYVWKDNNRNGIQDGTEQGIQNATVNLIDESNNVVATTTTNGTGNYNFVVCPGTYAISVNPVTNLVYTTQNTNTTNGSDIYTSGANTGKSDYVTLLPGQTSYDLDAGFKCELISNISLVKNNATCTYSVPNNNGSLSLASAPMFANRYRIRQGTNWNGVGDTSYATANFIGSSFPLTIQSSIPNSGADYIIRFYINEECYMDTLINFAPSGCNCIGNEAGVDKFLNCTTTSTTIGTTGTGTNYSWSPSTGLSATNVAMPTANPSVTTTYYLVVDGNCYDTVTVFVDTTPPAVDAGTDATLNCTTTSTVLGTVAIGGNSYSWLPTTGLDFANIAQPTTSVLANTTYTLTVTGANGCVATDNVTISIDRVTPTANAGSDVTLNCTTPTATIGTAAIAGNTYSWSPTTGLNFTNIAQPITNASVNTTYTVTVTGANGCTSTDEVLVSVDSGIPVADAGSDVNLDCNITTATIGTVAIGGNSYSWSPATGLDFANIAQPITNIATTTTYTLTVTNTNGCSATDEVTVNVNRPTPTITISGLTELCTSTLTNITATANVGLISWSNGSSIPSQLLSYGTYTATATDGVCIGTTIVTITDISAHIGNFVWNDNNMNGIQDADEVGISGVTVNLLDASLQLVKSTVTDAYGNYYFDVCPGTYAVSVSQPVDYLFTSQTMNTATGSDVYTSGANFGQTPLFTLTANSTNNDLDAGLYAAPTSVQELGNYVWNDVNKNGTQDINEPGVSGVVIELIDANTQLTVRSTMTNMNGYYHFDNLLASNPYQVRFYLPIGYVFTSKTANTANGSDVNNATGKTDAVTLAVNEKNMDIDAGIYLQDNIKAVVGDKVWNDVNRDGIQDANEPGMIGVLVTLYNALDNSIVASITTNALGNYIFNNLDAGQYYISFTTPSGFSPTTNKQGTDDNVDSDNNNGVTAPFTLSAGEIKLTIDAGFFNPTLGTATLGNKVWYDYNNDGMQNGTEMGVSGVLANLYEVGNASPIANTITDINGNYLFTNLNAGQYYVEFKNLPSNYSFTYPNMGGDEAMDSDMDFMGVTNTVTLSTGQIYLDLDGGIMQQPINQYYGNIGDRVWYDINQNGIQEGNETGVANITVTLYEADGVTPVAGVEQQTTDVFGKYLFTNLPAGQYVVGFSNLPVNYYVTTLNAGTDDELDSDIPNGTLKSPVVSLSALENNLSIDLGLYNNVSNASLGDFVWFDVNQNGIQDINENGVPGVVVNLYDANNQYLNTTTTDINGHYLFNGLTSGQLYRVAFSNIPTGFQFTTANAGSGTNDSKADNSGLTATALITGSSNLNFDAGIYNASKAALGNYVWLDSDRDGIQDANEAGVEGLIVNLLDANTNTLLSSAVTNANGYYMFPNLNPGTYYVQFQKLPSTIFTEQAAGGNTSMDSNPDAAGRTSNITLSAGEVNLTVDAGMYPELLTSVGDYVWFDINSNGIQDVGETGVPGITVILYNSLNQPVGSAITNANGYYLIENIQPGDSYSIHFTGLPTGAIFTTQNVNPTTGSDANPATGYTNTFDLFPGIHNPNIDAGIILSGSLGSFVFIDSNTNGKYDTGEMPVSNVSISLYDAATNTFIATVTTNPQGLFRFDNLAAGNYYVIADTNTFPQGYRVTFIQNPSGVSRAIDNDADVTGKTSTETVTAGTYNPNLWIGITILNAPLPLTLISFTGEAEVSSNVLKWVTANELNTKGFKVYKSTNQNDFEEMPTFIKSTGKGGDTYMLEDMNIVYGNTLYYLQTIDNDGSVKNSKVVSIVRVNEDANVNMYPNPSNGYQVLNISLSTKWLTNNADIQVYDELGKLVLKTTTVAPSMNIVIDVSTLSKGNYVVKITNGELSKTQKFVKN